MISQPFFRSWRLVLVPGLLLACAPALVVQGPRADASADGASPDVVVSPDGATSPDVIARPDAVVGDVPVGDVTPKPDVPPVDDVPTIDDVIVEDTPIFDAVVEPDVVVGPDVIVGPDVVVTPDVVTAPDAPSSCALPLRPALMLPSDTRMGTVAGASAIAMACTAVGGPEHVFPFTVTARTGLQLDTGGSSFDTVLYVRPSCASATGEVACNDDVPGGNNAFLRTVINPGTYYAVVDTYGTGTGGAYTLRANTFTPAANAECAGATVLTPGVSATGETITGGAPSAACDNDAWGPQLHHTVSVPAGRRAVVTATPTGAAWSAIVRARATCAATSCLGSGTSPMAGAPAVTRVDNRGTAPLTVQLSVASTSGRTSGAYTLAATIEDIPTSPANANCAGATPLAAGATIAGESLAEAYTRLGAQCLAAAQGPSRFYRVTLPARSTVFATMTPHGGLDAALRAADSCAASACAASANAAGADQPESLVYTNPTDAEQSVVLAAGSVAPSPTGTYDITATVSPPPTNTTCATALALPGSTRLTLQNSARGVENATGACLDTATGAALFYRVTIPARQTLTVRATPRGAMDAVVRVLPACGATSCLARANAGAAGAVETLSLPNATDAALSVVIAVGGASNAANGVFDLDVGVAREYVESAIAPACDDMTGSTVVPGATGDDAVSAAADLPFTFPFFGAPQLEYTVSTNGLLQLFPSLPATGNNTLENAAIPTPGAPDGFVAAFWDDLFAESTSQASTRVFGATPSRRFVVEWRGFSNYNDRAARMTFQAKLFETTGVIELHYCAITAGMMAPLATGGSATVGIESPDGRSGRQHSFNTPMSVSTAGALRYTP